MKKSEEKKIFKCDICSKEYPKKVKLRRHVLLIHDENKPFRCPSYFFWTVVPKKSRVLFSSGGRFQKPL